MYKAILFFIAGIAILISCDVEPQGYTLEGNVQNASGRTLYLSSQNTVDSTLIDESGNFSFFGQIPEAEFFYLYLDPVSPAVVLIDTIDRLTLTADANDLFGTFVIEGSKDASLMTELYGRFYESLNKLRTIPSPLPGESDSLLSIKMAKAQQIIDSHRQYLVDFVSNNPSRLSVLPALYQSFDTRNYILNPGRDYDLFQMVADSLAKSYPNSKHVKTLQANLIEIKQRIEMENAMSASQMAGREAPDFTLPAPDGSSVSLSDFRGKYVLLDFWASWCAPCRKESPYLVKAYNNYKSKGFDIFQVSLDKTKDAWLKAIDSDGLGGWKHASDLKFWDCAPAKMYGVQSIPSNFLIDKDGMIVASDLRGEALEATLKGIFN